MAEKKLANKVAIVTGFDSGIGQATVVTFAREGADVAVIYLKDQKGADRTVQLIEEAGQKVVLVHLDQTQPESVEQLFQTVKNKLGTPTVLVNNAAASSASTPVKDMSFEDWDRAIKTNLYGPFLCCQQFIRAMDGSDKRGVIINITSVHEEIANPGTADYCAAKGGLRNLTRVLALELADKQINVNNIAPGMILTAMNQSALDDPNAWKQKTQNIPMKQAGGPQEIAHAAVFLASKGGKYIHGTTLFVDGGLTQNMGQGA